MYLPAALMVRTVMSTAVPALPVWAAGSDTLSALTGELTACVVAPTTAPAVVGGEVGPKIITWGAARGAAVVRGWGRLDGAAVRDVDATFRRRQGAARGGEGVARAGRVDGQAGEGGHAIDGVDGQSAAEHGAAGPAGQGERHRAGVGRGGVARAVLGSDSEAEGGVRGDAGGGLCRDHEIGGDGRQPETGECRIVQGRQERAGRGVVMHLKAVLVVVAVDTVGIAIVLHEHEREVRGEDGIQVGEFAPE